MLIRILVIIFFYGAVFAVHPQIELKYGTGIEAYKNGNYQLAIQEFEDILEQGCESPEIYYNLGNAFFRLDEIGEAIWAFEKCLSLRPAHEDALFNLSLANLKVVDRIDLPPPPNYLKLYNSFRNSLLLQNWIFVLSVIIMLLFIIRCFRLLFKLKTVRVLENILKARKLFLIM